MTAFDLCAYGLTFKADSDIVTTADYMSTFTLIQDTDLVDTLETEDIKSISHDFVGYENNRVLMIKLKYPIKAQIISRYKLTEDQQINVLNNIKTSLFIALNSKKMDFGSGVDYDKMYNAIVSADDRIKAVSLEYPTYEAYAVYTIDNGDTFKELRIDNNSLGGYVPVSRSASGDLYYYDAASRRMVKETSTRSLTTQYYQFDETVHMLWNKFRAEVFAKNVLCGVTPLYDQDTTFSLGLTQKIDTLYTDVKTIQATTTISPEEGVYTVLENENILFTAPNLIQESSYSSYVKFLYNFNSSVPANSEKALGDGEYIIFFWKAKSDDAEYTYIKYDNSKGSLAEYLSPSFRLKTNNNLTYKDNTISIPDYIKSGVKGKLLSDDFNKIVTELAGSDHVLSGTNSIVTKKINSIIVNNNDDTGSQFIYWITKDTKIDDNNNELCKLTFDNNEYYLDADEYFIYTNDAKTSLQILGQGTKLSIGDNLPKEWTCKKISYAELMSRGPEAIEFWVKINRSSDPKSQLSATEMTQQLIGPDNLVKISGYSNSITSTYTKLDGATITFGANGTENSLPTRSGDISWHVKSLLNLNVGPDKPQKIEKHQKITLKTSLTDIGVDIQDKSILTSRALNITSGKEFDVTSLAGIDLLEPIQVVTYDALTSSKDNITIDEAKRAIKITLGSGRSTTTIPVSMLSGKYLLTIDLEELLDELDISCSGDGVISPIADDKTVNRMYKLDIKSSDNLNLTVYATNSRDTSVSISINPLYKYTDTTLKSLKTRASHETEIDNGIEDNVIEILNKLDPDSQYDYTFSLDKHSRITNPLVAETFLYKNHFYNPYTICEWDVSSSETNLNLLTNVR